VLASLSTLLIKVTAFSLGVAGVTCQWKWWLKNKKETNKILQV